jgi:segregation and condensation protein B
LGIFAGGIPYYSMTDQGEKLAPPGLEACLEGMLFVAAGPVTIDQLAGVLERKPQEIEQCLHELEKTLASGRGLNLQWHAGRVQLTTSPQISSIIEKFLGLDTTTRLTRPALETLAIIAYRQPITRPGVDAIRGVSSDGVLKNLLSKGLIQEMGHMDGPGRPILFGTTADFLQYFGLSSLVALPPYEKAAAAQTDENNGLLKD